jgi:hypothetical protein
VLPSDEKALDRVRKLLALATSPNPHEAASAAAQAQALIDRHRLQAILDAEGSLAHDADPITDARDRPLETARKIRPWKALLAIALAEHNHCVAYTLETGDGQSLVLVGRSADRAAVETLWAWLVRRIEWLSATHGANKPKRWHDDFRVGVVDTIAERLNEAPSPVSEGLTDRGEDHRSETAIAIVDRAMDARREALSRFVESNLKLGPAKSLRVDARAWEKGRRSAEGVPWLPTKKPGLPE